MKRPKDKKKPPCVFWGCWPSTLLSIFCFCLFTNTGFSPENGLFCSLSASPFLSPWLLSLFLFHSLSLSLSVSCFFLPSLFSCLFFFSLCFCCSFLACFFLRFCHEQKQIMFINDFLLQCFSNPSSYFCLFSFSVG